MRMSRVAVRRRRTVIQTDDFISTRFAELLPAENNLKTAKPDAFKNHAICCDTDRATFDVDAQVVKLACQSIKISQNFMWRGN